MGNGGGGAAEVFDHLASGVQSLVVAVAVVVGGVWTVLTFGLLETRDKARADLAVAEKQLEDLKKRLAEQEVVAVGLSATATALDGAPVLLVEVSLHNGGNRSTRLELEASSLAVARATPVAGGAPAFAYEVVATVPVLALADPGASVGVQPWTILRPGEKKLVPFALPLAEPGLYLVRFAAAVEDDGTGEARSWRAQRFVVVGPPADEDESDGGGA